MKASKLSSLSESFSKYNSMSRDNVTRYRRFLQAYKSTRDNFRAAQGNNNSMMSLCKDCGNMSRVTELSQTRAADEESSLVSWCTTCGKRSIVA